MQVSLCTLPTQPVVQVLLQHDADTHVFKWLPLSALNSRSAASMQLFDVHGAVPCQIDDTRGALGRQAALRGWCRVSKQSSESAYEILGHSLEAASGIDKAHILLLAKDPLEQQSGASRRQLATGWDCCGGHMPHHSFSSSGTILHQSVAAQSLLLSAGDQTPLATARSTGQSSVNGDIAVHIINQTIPGDWAMVREGSDPLPKQLIGQDFLQCTSNNTLVVAGPSWDPSQFGSPGFLVQQDYTSAGPQPNATWCVCLVTSAILNTCTTSKGFIK